MWNHPEKERIFDQVLKEKRDEYETIPHYRKEAYLALQYYAELIANVLFDLEMKKEKKKGKH